MPADGRALGRPLVSIITPALNPGVRLTRCIESVRRQSYEHVEHIVIDGGSSDGTVSLLKETDDVQWISEPDLGQSDAINKGFKLGQGELLGWVNADDVLEETAVEATVRLLLQHPEAGWSLGGVRIQDHRGAWIRTPDPVDKPLWWAAGGLAAQPGSFTCRWALDRVGLIDETLQLTMDLDLWLRLIDAGIPHVVVPSVVASFEVHGGSKTGAIPHSAFIAEEAWVRLRSGRVRTAALAVGRASAWWRFENGAGEIPPELFRPEIHEASAVIPLDVLAAGRRVEEALLRLKKGKPWSALQLADPRILKVAEARGRLIGFARRTRMRASSRATSSG